MLLITERFEDNIEFLTEGTDKAARHYIQGVFMQSETKNRNGRLYPMKIMEREVEKYTNEMVKTCRALGELGHPEGPKINEDRAAHLVESLRFEGNDIIGKSKVLTTPMGKIVSALINDGVKFGVSSRGLGSLKEVDGVNVVQEDFNLACIDIVANPSAPSAFVDGIMEGREWVMENGLLTERVVERIQHVINRTKMNKLEETKLALFNKFLRNI